MQKKMLIGIVVFIAAIAVYVGITMSQNKGTALDGTEETTEEEWVFESDENVYSENKKDDINEVVIENNTDNINLHFTRKDNGSFIINGYDIQYNEGVIDSLMNHIMKLYYTDIIEQANDLSEYGLDDPSLKMNVKYADGSEHTVLLGNRSQDNSFNYVLFDDNKEVYISSIDNYLMYVYELSDFVYKYIPPINVESIMYLDVVQKGGQETEIAFTEEKTGNAAELAAYGMATLTMSKPIAGVTVYPTNLQETVLSGANYLQLNKIYKINPNENDKKECGLDEPFLTIALVDGNGTVVNLNIGNEADEKNYYCTSPLYPHIFTINKAAVESFIDIDILEFSEKFVHLIYRKAVSSIDMIENGNKKYEVKFEGKDMSTPEDQHDTRRTTINGKEIDYENFGKFYQVFAGVTFDSLVESVNTSGTPEIEFIVHFVQGGEKSIKYYTYDQDVNFYVVNGDKDGLSMLISKRSVREVLTKAGELCGE